MPWHVAETHPYGDKQAEQHLTAQGYLPFNPKVKTRQMLGRNMVEQVRPYIPGYIFTFRKDDDDWRPINYTRGIKTIMYADRPGQVPATVRVDVVEALRALCCADGYIHQVEADTTLFKVGQIVRVTSGAFEGHRGPITWTKGDRIRAVFSLLGSRREIILEKNIIEVIG
jgi:transcription antitermination factor NusG